MRRWEWWAGVVVVSSALALHALVPRYSVSVSPGAIVRVDRWTGRVEGVQHFGDAPWAIAVRPSSFSSDLEELRATSPR